MCGGKISNYFDMQMLHKEHIKLAYHKNMWNFSIVSKKQLMHEYYDQQKTKDLLSTLTNGTDSFVRLTMIQIMIAKQHIMS